VSKQIYGAGVTSLTKDQIKKIYSGEISNWNVLGGPNEEIYVVAREQGSGTRMHSMKTSWAIGRQRHRVSIPLR